MDTSIVLSIIGIFLDVLNFFVSPDWVKSTINKTILSNHQKRIESIIEDYASIKFFSENKDRWIAGLIGRLSNALYHLTIFVFWVGIYTVSRIHDPEESMAATINRFMTFYFLFDTTSRFNDTTRFYNRAANLEGFKAETIKKLKKLGGNPEELDKIDQELEAEKQGG